LYRALTRRPAPPRPQRTWEIWSFVFKFVLKRLALNLKWTYALAGGFSEERKKARLVAQAVWLREGLLRLGPTFIKVRPARARPPLPAGTLTPAALLRRAQIGQQFSTRVDVLSPELIKELEKLQDRVPPFGSKAAVKIIEEQLGGPLETHFQDFEMSPIAAASLGQVHRARLNGRRVVVKVQRPGLRELFEIDLKNLRCACAAAGAGTQALGPRADAARSARAASSRNGCRRWTPRRTAPRATGSPSTTSARCVAVRTAVHVPGSR